MTASTRYWAVVPAAGAGRRMGMAVPKQYQKLGKQTVLEHSIDALLACGRFEAIVVVISPDDGYWETLAAHYSKNTVLTVTGGEERCHSVLAGLDALAGRAAPTDWVLVHDAARPCVRPDDICRLIDIVSDGAEGGLLGLPVTDTVKQSDEAGHVMATLPREKLWRALTPQMFRLGQLHEALAGAIDAGALVTDEACAMERAGYRPLMVEGHGDNIKVTLPADLMLAGFYLESRKL